MLICYPLPAHRWHSSMGLAPLHSPKTFWLWLTQEDAAV